MRGKSYERVRTLQYRIISLVWVASQGMNRNEVMQSLIEATQKMSWRIRKRKWRGEPEVPVDGIVPYDVLLEARKNDRQLRRALRIRNKIEQLEGRN
jgi:hypothetical protein